MSTTYTHEDADARTLPAAETIDDVRYLEVGDRVRLNDRAKPLTVIQTGARTEETLYPEAEAYTQHAVQLQGDWKDARKFVVVNQHNHWHGDRTGTLMDYDAGRSVTLELVEVRE
jgi:hypothetical protein